MTAASRQQTGSAIAKAGLFIWMAVLFPGAALEASEAMGEMHLRVIDKDTRRPIAQAELTVIRRGSESQGRRTDEDGVVRLEGLAPGLYGVRAERAGYVTVVEASVRVAPRRTTSLELELISGGEELEEVVVVASAVRADAAGAVIASYFDREALRSAIGSGSDVLRALDGMPGLVSLGEFSDFSVRGRGPRNNLILVDGLPYDKVVHFDQTLGEKEEIGGGGRFSIFAPNLVAGAEFSPGGWSAAYGGRAGHC